MGPSDHNLKYRRKPLRMSMAYIILYCGRKRWRYTLECTMRKLCSIIELMGSTWWPWCIKLILMIITSWPWRSVLVRREKGYYCLLSIGKLVRFIWEICIGATMFLFQRKPTAKNNRYFSISSQTTRSKAHGYYKESGITNGVTITKKHTSAARIENYQNIQ